MSIELIDEEAFNQGTQIKVIGVGGGGGVKVDMVGALVVKFDGTDKAAPARLVGSSESSSAISAMICDCSCASTADKSEPE